MKLVWGIICGVLWWATGCTTAAEAYPVTLRRSRVIAPKVVGKDVKASPRAALVGCNLVMYAEIPRGQAGAPHAAIVQLTPAEVALLSDRLLATFLGQVATVPHLAWRPVAEVLSSTAYRDLDFPSVQADQPFVFRAEPLVVTAPAGFKVIQAPGSESDYWLHQSIRHFPRRFDNFFKTFQKRMSQLAADLDVDTVWILTTHVRCVPSAKVTGGWRAELTLVELTAVGRKLPRDFSYAFWIDGPLTARPDAPLPAPPSEVVAHLIARPGVEVDGLSPVTDPIWPQLGAPYLAVAQRFRQSLLRLRGLE
jgi:hypothetical protein